jgi:hypothetical protein
MFICVTSSDLHCWEPFSVVGKPFSVVRRTSRQCTECILSSILVYFLSKGLLYLLFNDECVYRFQIFFFRPSLTRLLARLTCSWLAVVSHAGDINMFVFFWFFFFLQIYKNSSIIYIGDTCYRGYTC